MVRLRESRLVLLKMFLDGRGDIDEAPNGLLRRNKNKG